MVKLLATFNLQGEDLNPITSTTVPRSLNDTYTIEFSVANPSDIQASNGAVILRICDKCSYAEEPQWFKKIPGAEDYDRQYDFQRIFSRSQMQVLKAKIKVNQIGFYNFFTIGLLIACENCVPPEQQRLRIHVQ